MKIIKLFIVLVGIGLVSSCQKEFLERTPQDRISDAEYWTSVNDLKLYCNSFYNQMIPDYAYGSTGIYGQDADQGSDNMIGMDYNTALNGERTMPASGGGWDWSQLRNINYFLDNYGRVSGKADDIAAYRGEALFFRAWFYFQMLKKFGDLPWINKTLNVDDEALTAPRVSRSIIADSIIHDLTIAIEGLPSKISAPQQRVTKEIAMAFLTRVALYEGTWEKYHAGTPFGVTGQNGKKFFEAAASVAETLMSSGVQGLDNVAQDMGYWKLFNQTDYSGSNEIMFWRRYSVDMNVFHNWPRYTAWGAGRGVTKSLVDDYLCFDGKPRAVSKLYQGDDRIWSVVGERDPRLAQLIYKPGDARMVRNGEVVDQFWQPLFAGAAENKCATGYQLYKGHTRDYDQQISQSSGYTGLILIRYAEVLLNYAEAKAELGTFTQADADKSINLLRGRVWMPALQVNAIIHDPNWLFPNLSPLLNEIRRERRVELACEGFRHDDIFRWAEAGRLIKGWKPKGAKKAQWNGEIDPIYLDAYPVDDNGYIDLYQHVATLINGYNFKTNRDYLLPLPTQETTLNPSLGQNPGW